MANPKHQRIQKLITIGLLVLLIAATSISIITYSELNRIYRTLYATILDPIGLGYFRDEALNISDDATVVMFYGDSRAAQWQAPDLEGYTFINRGIGNQTSAQVLLRFDEHIQPLHPDLIVIQVCINDLKTVPLFPERGREIISNCKTNLDKLIQKSLALDATVILTTVFPTSGKVPLARQLVWSEEVEKAIDEVNIFIRAYQADNVIIFDAAETLSDSSGNTKSEYVHDLLHLKPTGYEVLNTELAKILKSLK